MLEPPSRARQNVSPCGVAGSGGSKIRPRSADVRVWLSVASGRRRRSRRPVAKERGVGRADALGRGTGVADTGRAHGMSIAVTPRRSEPCRGRGAAVTPAHVATQHQDVPVVPPVGRALKPSACRRARPVSSTTCARTICWRRPPPPIRCRGCGSRGATPPGGCAIRATAQDRSRSRPTCSRGCRTRLPAVRAKLSSGPASVLC